MSNVLIGIIGVILFIGLALAGALFLGPRFQESTNASKASATVQAVTQVARAIELRTVSQGVPTTAATDTLGKLASEGWLKSVPSNPSGGDPIFLHDKTASTTGTAHIIAAMLPRQTSSKAICEAVARNTGSTVTDAAAGMPTAPVGCAYASGDPLYFLVYATLS
jgi:hypothetical protein